LVDRPGLRTLFGDKELANRTLRNLKLIEAVEKYGYAQKELADFLGLHYSTISRLVNGKQ